MTEHRLSARHVLNLCALVVGAVAFVFLLRQVPPAEMLAMIQRAGGWLAIGVGLAFVATFLDAAALHAFMRPEARTVSYWRVLAAQASGLAVNLLTPGGKLGEATKVTLLVGHAPRDRVVSSVLLFNMAYLYVAIALLVVGIPVAEVVLDLPQTLAVVLAVVSGAILLAGVGLGVLVHRGMLGSFVAAARSLRMLGRERGARVIARLEAIDRHLRELHVGQSPGTRLGMLLVVSSKACVWGQTYVTLRAAGAEPGALVMLMVLSAGTVIDWVASVVPLGIGVADGSNYALYGLLGLGPMLGVSVTGLRRAQQAAVAGVGIAVLLGMNAAEQVGLSRRRARLRTLATERGTR
jgi:hypothetical protein